MTTTLTAMEKFFYNGRNIEKEEQFEAEDIDVMLLTHHHTPKASIYVITPGKKKSEPEAKPAYKRRDMKAED